MKKIVFCVFLLLLLSACTSTPEKVSLEATVQSAVSTAIAPYEERYKDFVTAEDLEASQDEQNAQIKAMIQNQIELYNSSVNAYPEPTATVNADDNTKYEFSDNKMKPTATARVYNNDATCVDRFTFISDITVPDGMIVTPYTQFTKSWYIKNTGECTWNSNYKIIYSSGDEVGNGKSFSFLQPGYFILPGESVVVSAQLEAPNMLNETFTTYWAMESDRGEVFGSGDAKNVFLTSKFTISNYFNLAENFGSLTCSDDEGYITCGVSNLSSGRGVVYYDGIPTLESHRGGNPAIVVCPPLGKDNSIVRFEFGPLRFPRRSIFYTNFCCRPDTPHCDVTVRLYTKEPGYDWVLRAEDREWNDGFMGEWKVQLDQINIFDQDFYYMVEVETNGGATEEDMIMFTNFKIY